MQHPPSNLTPARGHARARRTAGTRTRRGEEMADARTLSGAFKPVAALTPSERRQMYRLMDAHYQGVTPAAFARDLSEKEWAILLTDAEGRLQGFSTLMRLRCRAGGRPVIAYFSGDTIVHRDYWGQQELPRIWGQRVLALADQERIRPIYWFLISGGYKTYRYLPLFFREFWPRFDRPTPPAVRQVIDTLARAKFGDGYEPERGIIRPPHPTPVRPGVADITPERLKDPHVAFFLQANPDHDRGDELACLAELSWENLTPAGRRLVGGGAAR